MGRAGKQRRSADAADFLKSQGINPAENRCAQIGTKAGNHIGAAPGSRRHRPQRKQRNQQHFTAAAQNIVPIGRINAAVQNIAHNGGQQQRANAGKGNEQHSQHHLAAVGLEIW